MAFGNIAGAAAFILRLDKSDLEAGLASAERQFATSTGRMARSADDVGGSATRAGAALGGAGLAGRMGLVGAAAYASINALQQASRALKVTGAEAGTTSGRFRNLGASLASGDIVGGLTALSHGVELTDAAMKELASSSAAAGNQAEIDAAKAVVASLGWGDLTKQLNAASAAATALASQTSLDFALRKENVVNSPTGPVAVTRGTSPNDRGGIQGAGAVGSLSTPAPTDPFAGRVKRANDAATTAVLTRDLGDDLRAQKTIVGIARDRLAAAKKGTDDWRTLRDEYAQAVKDQHSIEDQIAAAEKSAADQSKAARERAAADRKAANDEAKRAAEAAARAAEQAAAEDARRLRAGLTLRETVLRNDLAAAGLTEKTAEDDKKALRKLIAFDKKQEANRKLTLLERQQYRTKEIQDRAALAELNKPATKKKDGKEGGTAADFKEMSFAFLQSLQGITNQFGSNVQQGKPNVTVNQHFPHPPTRDLHTEAIYARHALERLGQVA